MDGGRAYSMLYVLSPATSYTTNSPLFILGYEHPLKHMLLLYDY